MPTWLFTAGWAALAVLGLGLEFAALRRRERGDTLSEHVWKIFLIKDKRNTALGWLLRVFVLGAMTWLTMHFGFGL